MYFLELLNYKTFLHKESKEWIVFLHGAGGSIATWNRQTEAFKQYCNLLLVDLRDHGGSKNISPSYDRYNFDIVSQDVLKVLEHEGINRAHFVTLSFGSVLMQALYKRRPEIVNRMVFIGGVFNANWGIKGFVHLARFLNLFLSYHRMYQIFSFLLMPKKKHQFARRVYQQQAQRLGEMEYVKWLGLYSEFFYLLKSFHDQAIHNPMLVLMGSDDYLFLPSARKFATKESNIELKLISGAGHICNIDQPEATNSEILTFLGAPRYRKERPRTTPRFETSLP